MLFKKTAQQTAKQTNSGWTLNCFWQHLWLGSNRTCPLQPPLSARKPFFGRELCPPKTNPDRARGTLNLFFFFFFSFSVIFEAPFVPGAGLRTSIQDGLSC